MSTTAHQKAAAASKDGNTRFVVYVPDQGADVFTKEQMRIWAGFVFAEAAYLNGALIAAEYLQ
jgi:hypothetical protein